MSRITISFAGVAALSVGLLGISSQASAAPVNGAVIGKAAFAEELTQKVVWHGRAYGWHGRPYGWRGAGWRRVGLGWRPGLAAAGVAAAGAAATGIAATAAYNNYGYGNYGYGSYYGSGPYAAAPSYTYTTATAPSYIYGYTVVPGYAAGYGNNYGYGNYYGGYGQSQGGAAVAAATPAPAASAATTPSYGSSRHAMRTASTRWTRGYCINAVHERLGVSSSDAGKDANRDAVIRCMQRGPMAIG